MKEILDNLKEKGIDKIKFTFIDSKLDKKIELTNEIELLSNLFEYHNIDPFAEIFNVALDQIKNK